MKTNVAQTSIDAFYGVVQTDKQRQHAKLLAIFADGNDYSFRELSERTGMFPSTISARVNELRDDLKLVERAPRRQCQISRIAVIPHRLKAKQAELA